MSQKIQVRRGTNADRQLITLDLGEPAFTSDTRQFFVGDGVTAGGIQIGDTLTRENESFIAIIPSSGSTVRDNASGYILALEAAANRKPYGKDLSYSNRFAILLFPGVYDCSMLGSQPLLMNPAKYIDTIGIGDRKNITITSYGGTYFSSGGDCVIKNLSIIASGLTVAGISYVNNLGNVTLDNVFISGGQPAAKGFSIQPLNYADSISGLMVIDSYLYGGILSSFSTMGWISNSSFINSIIDSRGDPNSSSFCASHMEPSRNNTFRNCSFLLSAGGLIGYSSSASPYSFDSSNIFKDCYFSGGVQLFTDDDRLATVPFQAQMYDCIFDSNIGSFYGQMTNCTIGGRQTATTTITLNNAATPYPTFYNCSILTSTALRSGPTEYFTGYSGSLTLINRLSGVSNNGVFSVTGVGFSGYGTFTPSPMIITSAITGIEYITTNFTGYSFFTGYSLASLYTGTKFVGTQARFSGTAMFSGSSSQPLPVAISSPFSCSGLFSNCRINTQMNSGITGRFGNQNNIVHSSFK